MLSVKSHCVYVCFVRKRLNIRTQEGVFCEEVLTVFLKLVHLRHLFLLRSFFDTRCSSGVFYFPRLLHLFLSNFLLKQGRCSLESYFKSFSFLHHPLSLFFHIIIFYLTISPSLLRSPNSSSVNYLNPFQLYSYVFLIPSLHANKPL